MEFGELTSSTFETDDDTSVVELRVNATHDDVRLARLLVSGVASQAGFAVDEIEVARLVVDEACVILLDICDPVAPFGLGESSTSESVPLSDEPAPTPADTVVLRCERAGGALRVTATRPGARATSNPQAVSTRVLDGLTSKWSVRLDGTPTVMVLLRAVTDGRNGFRD